MVGFLLDQSVLKDGATASLNGWTKPVAEPEIAIEMGRDLPAGMDERKIAQAIAAIGPAIELADLEIAPDDVEAILAGNIFQRHVLFGPRQRVELPDGLHELSGQLLRNGQAIALPSGLEANTGRLLDIVSHVATTLSALGEELRAGDVIIAGSVTPPLMLDAGDTALRWELSPIGTVSVRFAG